MKLNAMTLAIGFGTLMLSNISLADGQGSGRVTFNGEIINAPCSVAPESVDQTVEMGQISSRALVNRGESDARIFSINLENCEIDESNDAVKVTFIGTPDPHDNSLLGFIGGTASGAGILLRGAGGAPIVLGAATPAQAITNGDQSLVFSAALKGYGLAAGHQPPEAVTAGEFTASTTFALTYE